MRSRYIVLGAVLALASFAVQAQSVRCVGNDGKKYYGSTVPQECMGLPMEQLNSQGRVIRHIDPAGDEAARAAKEAEAAKKRETDNVAREQSRRNRALLATYTSEKDIEEARGRALDENGKQMKQVEARIAEIKRRQAGFEKEMEFYQETPKGTDKSGKSKPAEPKGKVAAKPPPKLVEDMQTAQMDLNAQQNLLDAKKKEGEGINAKYDDDKKRFLELTRPVKR